ncbi:YceD family protein [Duganella callida]|uniref:Large ribosomal RNA subunit accumulation protein YceD n=1 Tax=Duganella callida TaxID=2561932 RepID=A0A4Y9SPM1_9BURK|nr:YceD family protein [Duganella callida]TFW27427.1 DUF177 domain-containing protein [Duganella callida]
MNAFVIDTFEFCRTNSSQEGATPVADMTRLAKDCADPSGTITWSAVGSTHKLGFPQMTLSVAGDVNLVCQRCLQPFAYHIDSSTVLMLGKDDAEADEIEETIDDESIDVIVGSRSMELMYLVEDEALLALPQSPRHAVCPDSSLLDKAKNDKVSPFDALKSLKSE